jgi:hypothetical protein
MKRPLFIQETVDVLTGEDDPLFIMKQPLFIQRRVVSRDDEITNQYQSRD